MYETYYDKLEPYFRQENIQLHYMDTDSFVLSVNTKDMSKPRGEIERNKQRSTLSDIRLSSTILLRESIEAFKQLFRIST